MGEGPNDEMLQDEVPQDERPQGLVRLGGGKVFSRVAILLLVLCAIAVGSATGLLFVYNSDLGF